ncbi:MAG TPA: DUF3344 domain-containing protein [Thermoanaerobaculia bacterium]|nr:DUF3344 domain-containing protein [Thermoanaerobaculia bacterium]
MLALPAMPATATTLQVALDVQGQGLSMAAGGTGLQAGPGTVTVNIGGPVQAALLYWAGRDRPCPQSGGACVIPSQPYKDQVLSFDGNLITGTIIGTEDQPVSAGGPINNIGYLADVTNIVKARGTGSQSFTIADGDGASNLFRLNGATLFVVYTNPADTDSYRLILFDGLDFAYGADPTPGHTQVTTPVTFSHGSDTAAARQAQLLVSVGDAEAGRPDEIDISNNPSLLNTLVAAQGTAWDSPLITINIPAGVSSTTLQLVSAPVDQNPDSLLWELGALRVPLPAPPSPTEVTGSEGCTPGYWKNHTGSWAGTGYSPGQSTVSVFSAASAYPSLAGKTLLQSLQGGGGPGTLGGATILLRAAVAALLNAAHTGVDYPLTQAQVISQVNSALASNNRDTMLSLASTLDGDNNLGCPLH